MNTLKQFYGLPKQVYLISIVRAIMAMGTFVFAFVSLMMTDGLGYDSFQAGNAMLFMAAANVLGSLSGGKLADAFGRKRMFVFTDVFAVAAVMAAGFYPGSLVTIVLVILSYTFNVMTVPILAAMITDHSDETNRTECFSMLYLAQNIGFAIGPSIGGMLYYNYVEWAFWGQGILYTLSGLLMFFLVTDSYEPPDWKTRQKGGEKRQSDESLLAVLLKMPSLLFFVFCLVLLTICYQEINFMMPLHMADLFGAETGSKYSGLVWTVNGTVCVLFTPLIISISKRRNQLLNIAFAALLYAIGFGMNGLATSIGMYFLATGMWTAGEILISTGFGVYIAERAPESHRGRFQSLYEVARGFGRGIGPNLFGFYLLAHSFGQAWFMVSVICVAAVICILGLYTFEKEKERSRTCDRISTGSQTNRRPALSSGGKHEGQRSDVAGQLHKRG